VLKPLKIVHQLKSGGYGLGCGAHLGWMVQGTPELVVVAGREAIGKACGVPVARPLGWQLGTDPVDRNQVNVGTYLALPSPPASQIGNGQVCRPLWMPGRGGAAGVVRGRESRPHGQGRQRDRSRRTGMPGGRR
jgi:hypothetical protein